MPWNQTIDMVQHSVHHCRDWRGKTRLCGRTYSISLIVAGLRFDCWSPRLEEQSKCNCLQVLRGQLAIKHTATLSASRTGQVQWIKVWDQAAPPT